MKLRDSKEFKSLTNQKEFQIATMTHSIGNKSEFINAPSFVNIQKAIIAFREIIAFKNVQFKDQMEQIIVEMERGLFCDPSVLPEQVAELINMNKFLDHQTNQLQLPYFEVVKRYHEMFQIVQRSQKLLIKDRNIKFKEEKNNALESQIQSCQKKFKDFSTGIDYQYERLNNQFCDINKKFNLSQVKINELEEQNGVLKEYKEMSKMIAVHEKTIATKDEELTALKSQLKEAELIINQQKQQFESRFSEYQRSLQLLRQQKEKVEILNQRIYQLEYDLSKVNVRAAVAFNELTPRYQKFELEFKSLKIKKPLDKLSWDRIATKDYIESLFQTIRDLHEKNKELALQKQRRKKKTENLEDTYSIRNISPKSESRFGPNKSGASMFQGGGRFTMYKTERSASSSVDKQEMLDINQSSQDQDQKISQ
ncbi:UNKNOWN [Stylonychia lemnae]|uniref:Uncharacterized protein n=1 Tax=Stylonychia lemnae TaxID=5949 RepID=A0A077ZRN4_STYLE|nr:UNKNOWN [Stylonychia lemnae]|eukprot:CDW72583.1 UNKNOWN [Stylonychia lemnae]